MKVLRPGRRHGKALVVQALYDGAPVGLAFIDRQQRYRNLNRRLAEMNGLPVFEHLGRTVEEVLPSVYPALKPYLERVLKGEEIRDFMMTMPHPLRCSSEKAYSSIERTRLVSFRRALDEAGEVVGISVAVIECHESGSIPSAQAPRGVA